ncbi:MAG: LuxR family transcriptional regulator [Rhodopseudomonas palustris]|nr:LuxR family transcriptional regulator [Rhodopseudomonas palustris]
MLSYLASGMSNRQIAKEQDASINTVKSQVANVIPEAECRQSHPGRAFRRAQRRGAWLAGASLAPVIAANRKAAIVRPARSHLPSISTKHMARLLSERLGINAAMFWQKRATAA